MCSFAYKTSEVRKGSGTSESSNAEANTCSFSCFTFPQLSSYLVDLGREGGGTWKNESSDGSPHDSNYIKPEMWVSKGRGGTCIIQAATRLDPRNLAGVSSTVTSSRLHP